MWSVALAAVAGIVRKTDILNKLKESLFRKVDTVTDM